jgi:hypothetical protein
MENPIHRVKGIFPAQLLDCPKHGHHPDHLTSNIYSIFETLTADNLEYTDQSNLAQQHALYQHQQCIRRNAAAKEVYTYPATSVTSNNALLVAVWQCGLHSWQVKHHVPNDTALHLLCLQVDGHSKYSIPEKLNPLIENILESGMNTMGPMEHKQGGPHLLLSKLQETHQTSCSTLCYQAKIQQISQSTVPINTMDHNGH